MQRTIRRRQFLNTAVGAGGALALASTGSIQAQAPGAGSRSWRTAADMPLPLQEIYPVAHEGKVVVAGGISARLGVPYFTDRCVSYDSTEDAWAEAPSLPEPRHHAALATSAARLFMAGGFNGAYTHIWRMRGTVHELIDGQWRETVALPHPQAEGVLSTAPDGKLHLVTGQSPKGNANQARDDHQEVDAHWVWMPGSQSAPGKWESAAPIPTPRNSATGVWVDNQLSVIGGRTSTGNLSTHEIYDAQADRWTTARPLPLPQAGTASIAMTDGLIVFGGEIFVPESGVFKEAWHYKFSTDQWSALPHLPTPRHGLGAVRLGDEVFVVGGATKPSGRGTAATNEVFDLTGL